jgi:AcrR family transcriptional regulator
LRPIRLSRTQQQAITRERLLVAAQEVFSRLGYGGASVDLIAAEAGYSKGAVYSNFPNKEAILLELLRLNMERDMAELENILSLKPDEMHGAVSDWLNTVFADSDCPLLATELQLHACRSPEFAVQYSVYQEQQTQALARILQAYFDALSVALPIDALTLASTMTALAHGLTLQQPAANPDAPNAPGRVITALLGILTQR